MARYERPWWLFANKAPGLSTTVQTVFTPDEQRFIIRGEPQIQGLAWLTWGPVAALASITLLTGAAIAFDVNQQGPLLRALFIVLFLGLPILAWVSAAIVTNQLAKKHLQAERQADAQECLIWLEPEQSALFYRPHGASQAERLAYRDIRQVKVAPPIGSQNRNVSCLMLDTIHGPIMLLNEVLGSQSQKLDLAREIQQLLDNHKGAEA